MPYSLWNGWSHKGHLEASHILKIPIEGVIPTTNHLEAFNAVLKCKYIHQWKRAGKRLRFDLFVYLLITQILPGIFTHCCLPLSHRQEVTTDWKSIRDIISAYYMNRAWLDRQKARATRATFREASHSNETPSEYYV
ncbi:hypothetical protein JB92DRAFT_2732214 [Gautieria morchelliformis]|nr:hypothetical protein JB92DRAFT_2732214 [Gautieria morchelliformis]